MASKTYQLGADGDGQQATRLVFTRGDGATVEITGSYKTDDPDEQAFLDDHPMVTEGKAKAE